jgi:hypothetical protein
MSDTPLSTPSERDRFLASLWDLHSEIAAEVVKPEIDPGKVMRLTALGVNHCLVGVATLLVEEAGDKKAPDNPQQLHLFPE